MCSGRIWHVCNIVKKNRLSDEILKREEADKADGTIIVNTVNTDNSNNIEVNFYIQTNFR